MKRMAVLLAVAVLSGCGAAPVVERPEPAVSAPEAAPEPSETADCLDASKAGAAIVEGARSGELEATTAKAVRSPDFTEVYFVAVEFAGYQGEDRGVWATNRLDGSGAIMAVDGPAVEVTNWPAGIEAKSRISMTDPSVDAALECLG